MFGAEIKPYLDYIKAYRDHSGLPNRDTLEKIRDIYDEFVKDERLPKTNLGCVGCVKHMMGQLVGAVDRLGNEPIKLEPKIPHLEPKKLNQIDVKKEEQRVEKELEEKWNEMEKDFDELLEVQDMKWGEFKTYCKEQGLNVKGKKRSQLMEELGYV